MTPYVARLSGGLSSWQAAKRTADRYGRGNLTCLFMDTLIEDEDCYRFLIESAAHIFGAVEVQPLADAALALPRLEDGDLPARKAALSYLRARTMTAIPGLVWIAEGRTPWEVFNDERFLGNSRVDPCSKILKRQMGDRWTREHCDRETSTIIFGLSWEEPHRIESVQRNFAKGGWATAFPMNEAPFLWREDLIELAIKAGIRPPRLYGWGFSHNNCGGYCCKAGQASAALLLDKLPSRYAYHERQENQLRAILGDVSSLTDRRGGTKKPLSLTQFRERIQAGGLFDKTDGGACSCFVEVE